MGGFVLGKHHLHQEYGGCEHSLDVCISQYQNDVIIQLFHQYKAKILQGDIDGLEQPIIQPKNSG
jgi:hypothetical protein